MLWLGIVLGVVVGVPLLAYVVGSLLPRDHVARATIELRSPPERVWAVVSDIEGTARWRAYVKKIELKREEGGRLRWVETSSHGGVTFELVSQDPPRRQVVRIADDSLPFGGTWAWEIVPDGAGSRLTIEEAGFVKNPVFRLMGKLFFSPTKTIEGYMKSLAKELGEPEAKLRVEGKA